MFLVIVNGDALAVTTIKAQAEAITTEEVERLKSNNDTNIDFWKYVYIDEVEMKDGIIRF